MELSLEQGLSCKKKVLYFILKWNPYLIEALMQVLNNLKGCSGSRFVYIECITTISLVLKAIISEDKDKKFEGTMSLSLKSSGNQLCTWKGKIQFASFILEEICNILQEQHEIVSCLFILRALLCLHDDLLPGEEQDAEKAQSLLLQSYSILVTVHPSLNLN